MALSRRGLEKSQEGSYESAHIAPHVRPVCFSSEGVVRWGV
jgi:hypothetical protein